MKLPPFTLVHQRAAGPRKRGTDQAQSLLAAIHEVKPGLADSLRKVKPSLRGTLLTSSFLRARVLPEAAATAAPMLERALGELRRQPYVVTIGIWDLGARIGFLPRVIETLNQAQPAFAFFEVQAAIPAGMISRPERIVAWAQECLGRKLTQTDRADIQNNVIANEFYIHAESIRQDLGIAYLAGITPSMVAEEDDAQVYWNLFASFHKRTLLISTYDLRRFANQAGRPFEAAVAGVLIAELLVALHYPRLGFHSDTGCLFDDNQDRASIVSSIRDARIEDTCLTRIAPKYRESVAALVEALRAYTAGEDS